MEFLKETRFQEADDAFLENKKSFLEEFNYETKKAKYIEEYFKDEFVRKGIIKHAPDLEQSEAIGALGGNVLISARAGSGKTQTISGKVAFLCKKYGIKPEEILVLCFNNSAARNMKERIQEFVPDFKNARTFHSFSYGIVRPERLLSDERGHDFAPKKLTNFISQIIREVENTDPTFRKKIYNFFRDWNGVETFQEEEEYTENKYQKIRNIKHQTLNGEMVKSMGEKWIADFLFEHGIKYRYEQRISWDKINNEYYHPDFSIYEINGKKQCEKIILEHWGIDEKSSDRKVPLYWTKSWSEYKDEMKRKREFCKNKKYKLLETSICNIDYEDKQNRRKFFEDILRDLIEQEFEINLKKRSIEELIQLAYKNELKKKLDGYVSQFIGWMQKKEWSVEDVNNEKQKIKLSSAQEKFIKIGTFFYKKYSEQLNLEKQIDFNILMSKATEKIKKGKYDVSEFKWILIDEFQDFSQLFQNLIDSILEKNPNIKRFYVGDSWQMINGFAGSDLSFFENIRKESNEKKVTTCYRSLPGIIKYGNDFAINHRETFDGALSTHNKQGFAHIEKIDISNVFINHDNRLKNGCCPLEHNEFKKEYREEDESKNKKMPPYKYDIATYLMICAEIVEKNKGKDILLLARNNKILQYEDASDLCEKLRNITKYDKIRFKTMHSSKGLEDDVVILLDVCEDVIPSIHPSNELFEIFGRLPENVLEEEKRLFYVAVTRAKEQLYILTETGRESEFLKNIAKQSTFK